MSDENNEEVKTVAPAGEAPEEELIPEEDSEETETPAPASGEDKPADGSEEEAGEPDGEEPDKTDESTETDSEEEGEDLGDGAGATGAPDTKKPKPVEGETPREYALRMEVTRKNGIIRTLRGKKLLGDVQPQAASQPAELSEDDKKALEAFDPEQVANMGKLFPILAKQQGFVKKDELHQSTYQSASQDALDSWLGEHTEYLPENDKGDVFFNRLKSEIALYQKPANPKDWTKILNRAHNEIMGIKPQPKEAVKQIQAKQEKLKVASHGPASGGSKKGEQVRKAPANVDVKAAMASGALKGFDESDFS